MRQRVSYEFSDGAMHEVCAPGDDDMDRKVLTEKGDGVMRDVDAAGGVGAQGGDGEVPNVDTASGKRAGVKWMVQVTTVLRAAIAHIQPTMGFTTALADEDILAKRTSV